MTPAVPRVEKVARPVTWPWFVSPDSEPSNVQWSPSNRMPVDQAVIERAKSPFAVNVRALDAVHVATAEVLAAEAAGEPMEFWTHDERQATAALSRGLTVRGVNEASSED